MCPKPRVISKCTMVKTLIVQNVVCTCCSNWPQFSITSCVLNFKFPYHGLSYLNDPRVVSFWFRSKAYDSLRWSSVIDIWLTLTLRYILQLVEHRGSENRLPSSVMSRTAAKPTSLCPQLQENGNHIQVLTNLIAVAVKQKFRQLDGAQNELHPLNNKLYLSWFISEETSRSLPGKIDF